MSVLARLLERQESRGDALVSVRGRGRQQEGRAAQTRQSGLARGEFETPHLTHGTESYITFAYMKMRFCYLRNLDGWMNRLFGPSCILCVCVLHIYFVCMCET